MTALQIGDFLIEILYIIGLKLKLQPQPIALES
jgi:hypothetical protein